MATARIGKHVVILGPLEKARDRSHLVRKIITNKRGKRQTVWVKLGENFKSSSDKKEGALKVPLDEKLEGRRLMVRWTKNPDYDVERDWVGYMGQEWDSKSDAVEEIAEHAGIDVEERWEKWQDPEWRTYHHRDHDSYEEFVDDLAEETNADVRYHEKAGKWLNVHHEGLEGYDVEDVSSISEGLEKIKAEVKIKGSADAAFPWSGEGTTTEGEKVQHIGQVPGIENLHLFIVGDKLQKAVSSGAGSRGVNDGQNILLLNKAIDRSHLVKKIITNKQGKKQTVWVNPELGKRVRADGKENKVKGKKGAGKEKPTGAGNGATKSTPADSGQNKQRTAVLQTIKGHLGEFVKNLMRTVAGMAGEGLKGTGAEEAVAGAGKTAEEATVIKKKTKTVEEPEKRAPNKADAKKLKKAVMMVGGYPVIGLKRERDLDLLTSSLKTGPQIKRRLAKALFSADELRAGAVPRLITSMRERGINPHAEDLNEQLTPLERAVFDRNRGEIMSSFQRPEAVNLGGRMVIMSKAEQTWSGYPLHRRARFQGMDISIENDVGSVRTGKDEDEDGHEWRTTMKCPYGYIRRTLGHDGDKLDCFLGQNESAENVTLIGIKRKGSEVPDEQKAMLGFDSEEDAIRAWADHYDVPTAYFQGARTMPLDDFKRTHIVPKNRRMRKIAVMGLEKADKPVAVYLGGHYIMTKAACKPGLVPVQRAVSRKGKKHWQQYCVKDPQARKEKRVNVKKKTAEPARVTREEIGNLFGGRDSVIGWFARRAETDLNISLDRIKAAIPGDAGPAVRTREAMPIFLEQVKKHPVYARNLLDKLDDALFNYGMSPLDKKSRKNMGFIRADLQDLKNELLGARTEQEPAGEPTFTAGDYRSYQGMRELIQEQVVDVLAGLSVDYDPINNRAVYADSDREHDAGDPVPASVLSKMMKDDLEPEDMKLLADFRAMHEKLLGPRLPGLVVPAPKSVVRSNRERLMEEAKRTIDIYMKPGRSGGRQSTYNKYLRIADQLDPESRRELDAYIYPKKPVEKDAREPSTRRASKDSRPRQTEAKKQPKKVVPVTNGPLDVKASKKFGGWAQFYDLNYFHTPDAVTDRKMIVLSEAAKPNVLKKWKSSAGEVHPARGTDLDENKTRAMMKDYLAVTVPTGDHVPATGVKRLEDGNVEISHANGFVKLNGKRYDAIHALTSFNDILVHPDTSSGRNTAIFLKDGKSVAALAPLIR